MDDWVDVPRKRTDTKLCQWSIILVTKLQRTIAIGTQATLIIAHRGDVIKHLTTTTVTRQKRPQRILTLLHLIVIAIGGTILPSCAIQLHTEKNQRWNISRWLGVLIIRGWLSSVGGWVWRGGREWGWRRGGLGRWLVGIYWRLRWVYYRWGTVIKRVHTIRTIGIEITTIDEIGSWLDSKEN